MSQVQLITKQVFDLEGLAFQGFEKPISLTPEEIRLLCAAVIMDEIGYKRQATRGWRARPDATVYTPILSFKVGEVAPASAEPIEMVAAPMSLSDASRSRVPDG